MNKPNVNCYEVTPRVVVTDRETELTIAPIGADAAFETDKTYFLTMIPRDYAMPGEDRLISEWIPMSEKNYPTFAVKPIGGALVFRYSFVYEQEWTITVRPEDCQNEILAFPIYSVKEDLYERTPYLGDGHVHSSRSDGHESPGVVAANYRKAGFDFLALTDHRRYWPSEEMIRAYEGAPIDIKLFPGEEVHDRTARIHTVNFGGNTSVNLMLKIDEDALEKQFAEDGLLLKEKLSLPDSVNPTEFAARKWICEKIREVGGFAILAHPSWQIQSHESNVSVDMTEAIIRNGFYDAMEIVTGETISERNMQQNIYHELRAQGLQIPIVGNSDSHGTNPPDFFKRIKTLVFAPDCEFESLCASIRDLYSVAVEYPTDEEHFQVHGPLRLVRYGIFLLKYYFPMRNELCVEEGIQMQAYLMGHPDAKENLARLQGRTKQYADRFFGR